MHSAAGDRHRRRPGGLARPELTFEKKGFTGLPLALRSFIRERKIKSISIVGIDTDMSVLKIAINLFDMGIRPVVLVDCCASTLGLQAHLGGLAILSRNIGPKQVRDKGLGEGSIAASPRED